MSIILNNILSLAGKALWEALDDPNNWTRDEYRSSMPYIITYRHKFSFWVANGAWFLKGHDNQITFGAFERHVLFHKIKKLIKKSNFKRSNHDAQVFAEWVKNKEQYV